MASRTATATATSASFRKPLETVRRRRICLIQEAYGDSEYTKYVIPEVCRILSMKPKTEENKAHAGELGEMLKKGMTFQMPEDSEVEV